MTDAEKKNLRGKINKLREWLLPRIPELELIAADPKCVVFDCVEINGVVCSNATEIAQKACELAALELYLCRYEAQERDLKRRLQKGKAKMTKSRSKA